MTTNIRFRLVLSHLTVIIVAMGLSGFLLLSLFEQYFLNAAETSLTAQARIIAQAIVPDSVGSPTVDTSQTPLTNTIQQQTLQNLYIESSNTAQLQDSNFQLDPLTNVSIQLGTQLNTHIRILNAHGIVLVDSQDHTVGQSLQSDALIRQAQRDSHAHRILDGNRMGLAHAVERDGGLVAIIYLVQPLDDVIAVLQDLRGRWMVSTGGGLLLSAVVGLMLSQIVVTPLRRLTIATEAVARGNFDQTVAIHSHDELGRLSQTFNEMTERLRTSRQMQTDFVANVSHELRTPLASVKSMIETLRNGAVDDIEVRDSFLETLENETNRLIRLVNDLLLLSRVDSQGLHLCCESVELATLVQEVIHPFTNRSPNRIHSQVPDELYVSGDADRISQVLINLLDNAVKYSTSPHGVITISAMPDGEKSVLVTICDQGIGISAEDLQHVGQRFYRTDKARSRLQGGSGLGLAIAKALVEAHHGQLWLESEESVGTKVHFRLPKI